MDKLSPLQAARLSDEVEALACREMYAAAPAAVRAALGVRVERIAGATLLIAPGLPAPMLNRAIGLGLHQQARVEDVDAIAGVFRGAGVKNWWLHWNPYAAPSDMPEQLNEMGFRPPQRRSWAKMLRGADAPASMPTDLQIRPVTGAAAEEAIQVAVQAFEMPPIMTQWLSRLCGDGPWRMYAAMDGARVVGCACVFIQGQAAWLGLAAIAPTHRGRGGQAALMARRIADAGAAGALYVTTETGEPTGAGEANPSLENMKRCGFEQVASRLNYAAPM